MLKEKANKRHRDKDGKESIELKIRDLNFDLFDRYCLITIQFNNRLYLYFIMVSQKFCNILVIRACLLRVSVLAARHDDDDVTWPKLFKLCLVSAVAGSIAVVGALTKTVTGCLTYSWKSFELYSRDPNQIALQVRSECPPGYKRISFS